MRTYASLCRYLVLGGLMLICALPITGRAALTTWTLDDVRVSGTAPGTLTGWFTFDDVARAVVDFKLQGTSFSWVPAPLSFECGAVRAELQHAFYGLHIRDGGFDVHDQL